MREKKVCKLFEYLIYDGLYPALHFTALFLLYLNPYFPVIKISFWQRSGQDTPQEKKQDKVISTERLTAESKMYPLIINGEA